MLRVSLIPNDHHVTLKLEGKLFGPWCGEVARVCQQIPFARPIRLDLFDVIYADAQGTELLRALIADRGAKVDRCSSFVAELLKPLNPEPI